MAKLQQKVKALEQKLKDTLTEKDESLKKLTLLTEELKLQEDHFKREVEEQVKHAQDLAKNSLLNDNKFVQLMTKLNDEQRKYFKDKSQFENESRITADMARQKVTELQTELDRQSKYFEKQSEKYELEISMLKEFQSGI